MQLAFDSPTEPTRSCGEFLMYLHLPARRDLIPEICTVASIVATGKSGTGSPKISLVLRELLANAIEHGAKGGRNDTVEFRMSRTGQHNIELIVSDDGLGFDTDKLDLRSLDCPTERAFKGLRVVNALCDSLHFENGGRRIVCHLSWNEDSQPAALTDTAPNPE